ncbi:hypothetical protein CLF_101918 [Clonorchis sinensis]|uniref:Uncharacterized protein n=1 Tax=Clonorchis sinensis TaxID=79923 RepID=G7Y6V4_CLOSI|nr:hypothetical protein CLF_101918 [Clonorchis sinensis]
MRIFLQQVKLGPASVEFLYRTIVQEVNEADAMLVQQPGRSRISRKPPKRIRALVGKRSQLFFKKLTTGDAEDKQTMRKMRNHCERQSLNDKNKTKPRNLCESLDSVYQSVNPRISTVKLQSLTGVAAGVELGVKDPRESERQLLNERNKPIRETWAKAPILCINP